MNETNQVTVVGVPKLEVSTAFCGADVVIVAGGIVCGEITSLHYDEKTHKGHLDYTLSDRNIEKLIYGSDDSDQIDVYFSKEDGNRLKLEIDGVYYEGTSMYIHIGDPILSRRMYFGFTTTTFDTYELKDAPWYEKPCDQENRELVEV